MAVTWAQLRSEFHLKGTANDHDQSTHGGGGGGQRSPEIDRLVEQMGDWESTQPWNLTKDQAIAQTVPGFWHKTARGSESASWDGRYIRTTDDFYALPEETRRAVAYHEAGHALLEAAGGVTADDLDLFDKPGGQALGYNAEEILAEAYSALWSDPDWFDRMGADEIRQRVTEVAEAAGFPLPDRERTDTFHLKGTANDHDQSTHGGGGGVARVVDGVYDFTDFAGHGATYRDHETQQAAIAEFDALPDDALIALYHGTSQRLAKSIIETGRYIPGLRKESLDGVPLASFTPGIYVAPTYDDAADYGDTVVRIVAPKSALIPSKEAGLVNVSGLGRAFMNTSAGAVLRPEVEFEAAVVDRRRRELAVEFHLKGTADDHDQQSHAGGDAAAPDPVDDYHGGHRPTDTGPRIHDLWESESTDGLDVYENPRFFTGYPGPELAETIRQLRAVRGKPDAKVTIYRAAPRGAEIREGDWVSLSKRYARTHADSGNAGDDPVILEREVSAKEVRWAIDDLMEYGWYPSTADEHHRELGARIAEFHLKGTQYDHDQSTHGAGGGIPGSTIGKTHDQITLEPWQQDLKPYTKVESARPVFVDGSGETFSVKAANGQMIEASFAPSVPSTRRSDAELHQRAVTMLNGVADGYDMAPTSKGIPMVLVVHDERIPAPAAVDPNGIHYGSNQVLLNDIDSPQGRATWEITEAPPEAMMEAMKKWTMPAATDVGFTRYIGSHEYGHVRAALGEDDRAVIFDVRPMTLGQNRDPRTDGVWGSMSGYARTNAAEAHAEAFAEWVSSRGRTTNRFARAYADIFGWDVEEERALAASAGEVEMPDWDDIVFICDSLVDGPSYVIGDGTRIVGGVEEFHLKGTEYDHDQSTHAGGAANIIAGRNRLILDPLADIHGRKGADVDDLEARRHAKFNGPIKVADQMSPQERRMLEVSLGTYDDTRESVMTSLVIRDAKNDCLDVGLDPRRNPALPVGTMLQISHIQRNIRETQQTDFQTYQAEGRKMDSIIQEFADAAEGTNAEGDDYEEALANLTYELESQFGVSPAAGFIGALNRSWTESSQDHLSQAHQIAVANLRDYAFANDGTPESMDWLHSHPEYPRGLTQSKDLYHEWQGAFDAAARATYRYTQKNLPPDLEYVTVYRGVADEAVVNTDYDVIGAEINPLSSWSADPDTALEFGGRGWVFEARVPRESIYSTSAVSGLGSLPEWEVILTADSVLAVRVVNRHPDTDAPLDKDDMYKRIHGELARVEGDTLIVRVDEDDADWIKRRPVPLPEQLSFDPGQPRVPAGQPGGGRWTSGPGGVSTKPRDGRDLWIINGYSQGITGAAAALTGADGYWDTEPDSDQVAIARSLLADIQRQPVKTTALHSGHGFRPGDQHRAVGDIVDIPLMAATPDQRLADWYRQSAEPARRKHPINDGDRMIKAIEKAAADAGLDVDEVMFDAVVSRVPEADRARPGVVYEFESSQSVPLRPNERIVSGRYEVTAIRDSDTEGSWFRDGRDLVEVRSKVITVRYVGPLPVTERDPETFHLQGTQYDHNQADHAGGRRRIDPVSGTTATGKSSIDADLTMGALPKGVQKKVRDRFKSALKVSANTAEEHLLHMAESALAKGLPGRHWYQEAHDTLVAAADTSGVDPEVGIAIAAALSPGKKWEENLAQAIGVMEAHATRNDPVDVEHLRNTNIWANRPHEKTGIRNSPNRVRPDDTLATLYARDPQLAAVYLAKKLNASAGYSYDGFEKATALMMSNDPGGIDGLLGGAKVRSFYNNMARPQAVDGDVTVDIHMQRALANDTGSTTPGQKHSRVVSIKDNSSDLTGSPSHFGASLGAMPLMADVIRSAAAEFNARYNLDLLPHEFQAIVWTEQIALYPPELIEKMLKGPV